MLFWPWEEATNPTTVLHAAMAVPLTHGPPGRCAGRGFMARSRTESPRQAEVPGVDMSPGPYPFET